MTALMIARINVKDPKLLQQYINRNKEIAVPHGAEILYQGKVERVLNGSDDHGMLVVVAFPRVENVDSWFDSDEYQPLRILRDEAAEMQMTCYSVTGP